MPRRAQYDLLDWVPPEPVRRFDDDRVRAASIAGKVCLAVSQSLKESGFTRGEVAARMSTFLGEAVSQNMLNAYASPAREEHVITIVRFIALVHATRDRRLLEMISEMFGWIVMERRYLRLIELASLQDKQDELRRRTDVARRQAKSEGLL